MFSIIHFDGSISTITTYFIEITLDILLPSFIFSHVSRDALFVISSYRCAR